MKKHITQAALDAAALAWKQAQDDYRRAAPDDEKLAEYFLGKQVGIVEAFADLTGQSWINAEVMLRGRLKNS